MAALGIAASRAIGAGTLTFDASQFTACLDAYRNKDCDDGVADVSCDFYESRNFFCSSATSTRNGGTCTRICEGGTNTLCRSFATN